MYLEGRTVSCQKDFNPRSPCGERRPATKDLKDADRISIHAPRVGSDWVGTALDGYTKTISIHAPRVGSDTEALVMGLPAAEISIHAPRVGSDFRSLYLVQQVLVISIHAPRVGSDAYIVCPLT